jgi:hypothetical protein
MNEKELSASITKGKVEDILTELLSGAPVAFKEVPAEYAKFQNQIATALGCSAADVVVVGSGRFGFSLAPHKFGRPYHDRSDIDVVIVDANFFDTAWLELIRYDFKSLTFDADVSQSLREHRSNNVFWGYIEPYNLKTALSVYKKTWFPLFAALGFFRATAGRTVKARVYRTWEHAKSYHRYGIRLLAAKKTGGE